MNDAYYFLNAASLQLITKGWIGLFLLFFSFLNSTKANFLSISEAFFLTNKQRVQKHDVQYITLRWTAIYKRNVLI